MFSFQMSIFTQSFRRFPFRFTSRYVRLCPAHVDAVQSRIRKRSSSFATSATNPSSSTDQQELVIGDRAVERLKQIATSGEYLRILVDSGGCSGFEYKFQLVSAPEADDRVFEKDGARMVVDRISLDFLKGATIDYQVELIKAAFRVVQNPRAEKGCSCGSSFALKTNSDASTKK